MRVKDILKEAGVINIYNYSLFEKAFENRISEVFPDAAAVYAVNLIKEVAENSNSDDKVIAHHAANICISCIEICNIRDWEIVEKQLSSIECDDTAVKQVDALVAYFTYCYKYNAFNSVLRVDSFQEYIPDAFVSNLHSLKQYLNNLETAINFALTTYLA